MELTEKDFAYGIFKGGDFVRKKTLQDIISIPYVEYFLIAKYAYTYKGQSNITDWYQYFIVDNQGNPAVLKKGNFEVIYIDTDSGCTNFFGRNIHVYDTRKETTYQFKSMEYGISFIKEEVIPLLDKLQELGSWEAYQISEELNGIKKCYTDLEERYKKLEKELEELKSNQ